MTADSPRRLSLAALPRVPAESRPPVDPRELRPRIVHLGIGAFHRAHQALYTEAAEAAHGGGWGIAGVTQRSRSVVDALRPQDGLYSFTERRPDGPATRVVGTVTEVLHATDDGTRLGALLASAEITVVTLTVTEKGYRRDAATGGLALHDPLIRDDLAGRPAPASVAGQLAAGCAPGCGPAAPRCRWSPATTWPTTARYCGAWYGTSSPPPHGTTATACWTGSPARSPSPPPSSTASSPPPPTPTGGPPPAP
ncbi:hypothetical protein ABNG14_41465 [Streptomyces rapamycinicus]